MLAKRVLVVTGAEAKEACGMKHLCGGLDVGIEGGIHVVRPLWQQHTQEEDWGFLIIDALSEENHTAMLWVVRFEWPSGARFEFNCYHH